jgi:hypothetical protein
MRAVIALALQCMLSASAFAQDRITLFDMQGTWRGTYTYPDAQKRQVEFIMTIRVDGGSCRGRIEEPNTFGSPSTPWLYANTDCQLILGRGPPRLLFRKVYDGTGGQSHGVDYDGDIASDGRAVNGTWRIGTQSGRFSLIKQ